MSNNIPSAVLRPKRGASYIDVSIATFWRLVKDDPKFPAPFKIGPNCTVVKRADLDAWLESKAEGVES